MTPTVRSILLASGRRAFDFMGGALPAGALFSRASAGWCFDSTLALVSVAADIGRWNYNPSSGALQGLLVEAAATNAIRNASAGGTSAGTPGTTPTNWSFSTTGNNVTRTIVGAGTEDGIAYLEVRYAGTPSTGSSLTLLPEGTTQMAASLGQVWVGSWYARLVGGSLANATITQLLTERSSGGSALSSTTGTIAPTGAALKTQRFDLSRTTNQATVAAVSSGFSVAYTLNQAIDFTIRFGLPQAVQAAAALAPIVTTSAAVTRAADILTLAVPDGLYGVVRITRASGITTLTNVAVSGGYTVPADPSPLQRVEFWR